MSGSVQSVRALHSKIEDVEEQQDISEELSTLLTPLEEQLEQLENTLAHFDAAQVLARLDTLEKTMQNQKSILERLNELEANQKVIVQAIKS